MLNMAPARFDPRLVAKLIVGAIDLAVTAGTHRAIGMSAIRVLLVSGQVRGPHTHQDMRHWGNCRRVTWPLFHAEEESACKGVSASAGARGAAPLPATLVGVADPAGGRNTPTTERQ